ncbi:MAG: LytTR family transcriptional regulator [Alistipes sp.]|nr:LytTR family transcriptional regulator [Alistipes sp.]MBR0340144.1 LytTR family transcriptional regulator [Alistipes sp.]
MKPIPKFIYSRANQILMILFVPLFAFVFINIYRPLDFDNIDDSLLSGLNISRELSIQLLALMMVAGGMAVAAISRWILRAYTNRRPISYIGYIVWIFSEICVMASIYTLVAIFAETEKSIPELFNTLFVKTSLILLIPYTMCYTYFVWQENRRELRSLRKQIDRDETVLQRAYIQILDEKGEMRLSIRRENLVLIESADNYVCVYYINGDTTKKSMIRNTLSRVAEHLQGTRIVRCHRSYMINLDHAKILHRDKEGVFIEHGLEGIPNVPISRTYAENIQEWLTDRD